VVDVETMAKEEVADGSSIGTWNDGVRIEIPALQIFVMLPVQAEESRHAQWVHLQQIMNEFAKFE
jgi:hypothetical protein